MYEVICTTYSPDIQISVRENTNTVNGMQKRNPFSQKKE